LGFARCTDYSTEAFFSNDYDDSLDPEVLLQNTDDELIEDSNWANLVDETIILSKDDETDDSSTLELRIAFIQQFALLSDPMLPRDLYCLLCQPDPTADRPEKKWNRFQLDRHLDGSYHDRRDQIARANREDFVSGRVTCHTVCAVRALFSRKCSGTLVMNILRSSICRKRDARLTH
jgi:hypothetical protein